MRNLHDEFDACFIDTEDQERVPGPEMQTWLYSNHSAVFFALRDFVARHKAKEATNAALKDARDAINAAQKAFAGKFE